MRRRTPLAALAVLGLLLGACSDGSTTGSAADAPTGTEDVAVEIDDFAYDPESVEVAAGTTVTWSNEDATRHTVTAGSEDAPDPEAFDLEVDEQGQTVSFTFDEPGTYAYYCVLHPFMEGTIEVTG